MFEISTGNKARHLTTENFELSCKSTNSVVQPTPLVQTFSITFKDECVDAFSSTNLVAPFFAGPTPSGTPIEVWGGE